MTKARDLAAILSDGSILADGVVGLGEVTGGTNNGVVYVDGTGTTTNGSGLVFNGTNLGIGTSAPATKLQVSNTAGYSTVTVTGNSASGGILSFVDSAGVTTQRILGFGSTAGENTSLRFDTNGSEKMRLDSAGNLGLGVTPSAWSIGSSLEVGNPYAKISASGTYGGVFTNNAYYNAGWKYNLANNATMYQTLGGAHSWHTAPSGTAGAAISFTQAMTLNANGNLLLGSTTAPAGFARVSLVGGESSGSGANSGIQLTYNASTFGGGAITTVNASGGGLSFYTFTGNVGSESYTERARIDSSGNFNLNGTAGFNVLGFEPATTIGSSGVNYITGINTTNIGFKISTTEVMRINSSGNLLVGTTSSIGTASVGKVQILGGETFITTNNEVAGFVGVNSNADNSVAIVADPDSLRSGSHIAFYVDGFSEKARIDSSGNFQVGYTGSQTSKVNFVQSANLPVLSINNTNASFSDGALIIYNTRTTTDSSYNHLACYNGNFTGQFIVRDSGNAVNSNNSYGAVSDVKLKENIVDASPKLADLMQVKVRNYNLIGDTAKQLGVIAQELETVFPAMVEEAPDRDAEGNDLGTTTKSVKYSVFVPMLIKAMQEQQAIIESLTARVSALEGN